MKFKKEHWTKTFKFSLLRFIEQDEAFDFELLKRISAKNNKKNKSQLFEIKRKQSQKKQLIFV